MALTPRADAPPPEVAPSQPPPRDPHDDGLAILSLLRSSAPDHQEAAAHLRSLCPWKHSLDWQTGRRIEPATDQTVAAWAMSRLDVCIRLKAKGLI